MKNPFTPICINLRTQQFLHTREKKVPNAKIATMIPVEAFAKQNLHPLLFQIPETETDI